MQPLHHFKRSQTAVALLSLLFLAGCGEQEKIRKYTVAKSDRPQSIFPPPAPAKTEKALGAVIPHNDAAWAFFLRDDPELVDQFAEEFRSMVLSLKFQGDEPSWDSAEGWTSRRSPSNFIYAEILNESAGLRATVTLMPKHEDGWNATVQNNVNRWRGQYSMPQQSWEQIEPSLEPAAKLDEGESKAYFVSFTGKRSGGMGGPFQNMMSRPKPEPPRVARKPKPGLNFVAPEGWEEQDVSASRMRQAAFRITSGDETAELAVLVAGGDIAANMGMWFQQAGLEKTDEAIQSTISGAKQIDVNKTTANIYLIGDNEQESNTCILVAEVPWKENESLFVKLKASSKLIEQQRDKFDSFIGSMSW